MNTYLIYGNDYSLIKREIDKITKEINDVTTYDLSLEKVDNLLNDASVISMFGDKKALIGENALFLSTSSSSINHDLDYLQRYLEDDNHDNIVIFTLNENKLDERKKIVKLLKKRATVIHKDVIKDKDLPDFVMDEFSNNGYKIDYKTASYFVQYAGSNVDILISEINKMMMYKDGDKIIKIEDINEDKQRLHINGTKTENAQRDIKISKAMIEYLKEHNTIKPYFNFTSEYVTKHTTKLLKSVGIEKTLHSLRHTTATNLFYLGYKDKERQQYLGHANITTTNNIYTYLENDITKEDIHKLYNNFYYEN